MSSCFRPQRWKGKGAVTQANQRVSDMALEVLARQASILSRRTGEPFEAALEAVLHTQAGRRLRELGEGPYRDESAHRWQEDLPRNRAEERKQVRREERRQSHQQERSRARLAAWEAFMQVERRGVGGGGERRRAHG